MAAPPPADAKVDVACTTPSKASDVYDLLSRRRRRMVLGAVSFASILLPFSDTIYLPALHDLQQDLGTTDTLAAASVAIYMFAVGLSALVWGPAADRYGRRIVFWLASAGFISTSIVCTFAPNIGVLIAFRALQGVAVSAFLTNGNAVIADVYPPALRGSAHGVFMVPLLVGPVMGPVIGGALAQALGWRATFVALAIAGVVVQVALAVCVPETHQYLVLARERAKDPKAAAELEAATGNVPRPVFQAPWAPLRYLADPAIAPHAALTVTLFGSMFASIIVMPLALAAPPYNLSAAMIGVAFLAGGIAGLLASPIGGVLADKAHARWVAQARVLPGALAALLFMPAGQLVFGWTLAAQAPLAGPLAGQVLISLGLSIFLPGVFSFISVVKQHEAAAAAGVVQAAMFLLAGVLILVSAPVAKAIGIGPFQTILAGACALAAAGSLAAIALARRRGGGGRGPAAAAASGGNDAAGAPAASIV